MINQKLKNGQKWKPSRQRLTVFRCMSLGTGNLSGQGLRRTKKRRLFDPSKKKSGNRLFFKCVSVLLFLFMMYQIASDSGEAVYPYEKAAPNFSLDNTRVSDFPQKIEKQKEHKPRPIEKREVRNLVDNDAFVNIRKESIDLESDKGRFHVETSIMSPLQNFILEKIDRSTSRHIGIVAMEPYSGRVLAMVGFDKDNPDNNPCITNRFPAASVFKIVTAAAAIEKCGFGSDSQVTYSGRSHTLYKSQLKEKTNRNVRRITLRDSFAQSINPVFGKLGVHQLGKTTLEEYADAFGFNREINFELPLTPSVMSVSDETYHWAEVASGFNRETLISPLHGALIASAILNKGRLIEPVIIDDIKDENGQKVYQSRFTPVNQAITSHAAGVLKDLMKATITSGTCRKIFRGHHKDPVLSKLDMGGKTGSINSRKREARFDWFVGFAEEKDGAEKMVISIVVAHGKYIGIRAGQYARLIFKEHFGDYFSKQSLSVKSGK